MLVGSGNALWEAHQWLQRAIVGSRPPVLPVSLSRLVAEEASHGEGQPHLF
jgi:hypothetical protein